MSLVSRAVRSLRSVDLSLNDDFDRLKALVKNPIAALDTSQERADLKDTFVNLGGALVGVAGMAGIRYPVKEYRTEVAPGLWRGSRLDASDAAALKKSGIKSLIELTKEADNDAALARANGMNHLRIPIHDNRPPSFAQVKQFLDYVSDPKNQPAYVHCQAGKGRTGAMVAAYRMAVQGWSPEKALAEAKSLGMGIPDQHAFVIQLGDALRAGKIPGYSLAG